MQPIERFVSKVDYLPPAPQILPTLLPLLGNPDSDSSRLVQLIQYDPALTAQILKATKSAALARTQTPVDLFAAVNLLGFREIYRRVAILMGFGLFKISQGGCAVVTEGLWRHSVS